MKYGRRLAGICPLTGRSPGPLSGAGASALLAHDADVGPGLLPGTEDLPGFVVGAILSRTETGSGRIRGRSNCSKASSRITTGQRKTST